MTKRLDEAMRAVRQMAPTDQDSIAAAMLSMAQLGETQAVDPSHWQEVLEALEAVERGEVASPEEVAAAFRSFDR